MSVGLGLVGTDLIALVTLRPHVGQLRAGLGRPAAWLTADPDAALGQLAAACVWLAAVWVALGLTAAFASRLPGRPGRIAARGYRALLPRTLRGLLAGSAGLGVLLAPISALAAPAPSPASIGAEAAPSLAPPAWPVLPSPTAPASEPPAPTAPPTAPAASTNPVPSTPPASTPVPSTPPATRPPSSDAGVRVRPGDSLWLIAARRLGPDASAADIADSWPRWYAANREAIGRDPDLLHTGEVLHPPHGGSLPHRSASEGAS